MCSWSVLTFVPSPSPPAHFTYRGRMLFSHSGLQHGVVLGLLQGTELLEASGTWWPSHKGCPVATSIMLHVHSSSEPGVALLWVF